MTITTILIILALVCGFYAAWNIGANDVANAMGTSVGSGALTLRRAVILAAIFEFAGAYLVGGNVSETVRKKMFDPSEITTIYGADAPYILACGMIAALIATGTWLLIATWMSWPVSTTHSIIGAVVGFGVVAIGVEGVAWDKVGLVSMGWVISPMISGAIAYFLFGFLLRTVFHKRDPVRAAINLTPKLVFTVIIVMSGVTTYKGFKPMWKNLGYDPFDPRFVAIVLAITITIGVIAMLITRRMLERFSPSGSESDDGADQEADQESANPILDTDVSRSLHKAEMHMERVRSTSDGEIKEHAERVLDELKVANEKARQRITTNTDSPALRKVEKIFALLQVITACLVAFAHGSNDVANAIGPFSAAYQSLQAGVIEAKSETSRWALLLGGVGIVVGLATWGWRVIQTVGKRITELTPSRGFCAEFAAAITILLASTLPIGLPISTTHTLVGAVLGVGLARGINALNLKTMRDIIAGWAITIPAGAGLSVLFYFILKAIFIDSGWWS